jgi:8-oxo-dGTP pyrophosphatase MutT (NUDIX family)
MPHIHDKIDFTVEVFIVHKNAVLLRKHDKYKIWLSVGGHIELDEDPNQAAIREVMEEVGLTIQLDDSLLPHREKDYTKDLIPPYYLNMNKISETHSHITFVYFATSKSNKIIETLDNEKSEDCHWFTKEALLSDKEILPNIKFYALQALEKLANN